MRKRLFALTTAILIILMNVPTVYATSYGETRTNTLPTSNAQNSSSGSNAITEPEMRNLINTYFSKEEVLVDATMMYNVGHGPSLEQLKDLKVYADIETSHGIVDWSYYQPHTLDNVWREGRYKEDTARALNVLGNKLPIFYNISVQNDAPSIKQLYPVGTGEGYNLAEKRSLVIMSLYKAANVQYFNKPVVYLGKYAPNNSEELLPILNSTFFKLMPGFDAKFNDYKFTNFGGRQYLFVDNNYLEAYLVRAVNDGVISSADITPEMRNLIDKNYVSRGGIDATGVVHAGVNETYTLVSNNPTIGTNNGADLGVIYNYSNGSITYNTALRALAEEESVRLIDFAVYAHKIMEAVGEPVLSETEKFSMFSKLATRMPEQTSKLEQEAVSYLVVKGIFPEDISTEALYSPLLNDDALVFLSRVADEGTRIDYNYKVSTMDLEMAKDGYGKALIVDGHEEDYPREISVTVDPEAPSFYDYYIPASMQTKGVNSKELTVMEFSIDAPNIAPSWGAQLSNKIIDGEPYLHFQLPVEEPEGFNVRYNGNYIINSMDDTDLPIYISVPPGGGVYTYYGNVENDPRPTLTRTTPESAEGMWEGRTEASLPETIIVDDYEVVPFAEDSDARATLSFFVKAYKNVRLLDTDLQIMNPGETKEFIKENYSMKVTIERSRLGTDAGYTITVEVPAKMAKSISNTIKLTNSAETGFPCYFNKANGQLLVSTEFLRERCSLEVLPSSDPDYLSFYSTTGNGVETTLIKSINVAVSGSTVLNFKDFPVFEINAQKTDEFYVDYRAVANHVESKFAFVSSDGKVNVEANPRLFTEANIALWSDPSTVYTVAVDENERVAINSVPPVISSTLVFRNIDKMDEPPNIVQFMPVKGNDHQQSDVLREFLGDSLRAVQPLSSRNVPLSQVEFDADTGKVWYDVPDISTYDMDHLYTGATPFPVVREGTLLKVMNIPILSSKDNPPNAGLITKEYVTFSANYNKAPTLQTDKVYDAKTLNEFGAKSGKEDIQSFPIGLPTYIHGYDRYKQTVEVLFNESMKSTSSRSSEIVFLLGGGYYKFHRTTTAINSGSDTYELQLKDSKSDEFDSLVNANRAAQLSVRNMSIVEEALSPDGNLVIKGSTEMYPVNMLSKYGYSVYASEAEMYPVRLSGLKPKMFDEDSIFGTIASYAKSVFETIDKDKLLNGLKLENVDGILSLIYVVVIQIPPRIFILSLFSIWALSLVSGSRLYRVFAERVFDPVKILSFGLTDHTQVSPAKTWLSITIGIIFLLMVETGIVDTLFLYLYDQILGILQTISMGLL